MMRTLLCSAPSSSTTTSPIETSPPMNDIVAPPNSGGSSSSSAGGGGPHSSSPTSPSSNSKGRFNNFLSGKSTVRRPSIRKRIQSLSSRVSAGGASSLDKATATLSNAAGSSFSFFRHASGPLGASASTSTPPSSAGNASNSNSNSVSGSGTGSGPAHNRGASTSSFASGRSSKSSTSGLGLGLGLGHGEGKSRLNVLNISPPSAFKHQFHIGSRSRTSDEPWDDTRWRQVIEMRGNTRGIDHDDAPVIDVVPPTSSIVIPEPRTSTSSERNVFSHQHPHSHSRSQSQSHAGASVSSPNLLSIATAISTSNPSPSLSAASTSASPASASTSSSTPTTSTVEPKDGGAETGAEGEVVDKAKAAKQAKRASLVKRKPVPQINPEDLEPMPSPTLAGGASSSLTGSPVPTTFVLIPAPAPVPSSGILGAKVPETAPAGKTSFEVQESEKDKETGNVPVSALRKEEALDSLAAKKAEVGKEKEEKLQEPEVASEPESKPESTQIQTQVHAQALPPGLPQSSPFAPTHICILHSSPAPVPPPRRHTLAHMQARALGRGMCSGSSLPFVPSVSSGPSVSVGGTSETQMQEKTQAPEKIEKSQERKKLKARPLPIVAPSPGIVSVTENDENDGKREEEVSVAGRLKEGSAEEMTRREEEHPVTETATSVSVGDNDNNNNSPRPSLASLASTEGSETARSVSSGTRSSLEMEMEPRTPTDERRVSAGSAASVKQRHLHLNGRRNRSVRIVLPGEFPATDDEEEDGGNLTVSVDVNVGVGEKEEAKGLEAEVETPKILRCVSKRPNPPARRVEANEESVYVTADEADDV